MQKHVAAVDPNRPVERLWRIAARHAILASGAEERPLVFGGNDIPGVMMAGAMRAYLNRQAIAPGKRTVIFTNDRAGYALAADLEAPGLEVAGHRRRPRQRARVLGWHRRPSSPAQPCQDAKGGKALAGVTVIARRPRAKRSKPMRLPCRGGWSPVIHLACHRGARPVWSDAKAAFLAPEEQDGLTIAGAAAGIGGTRRLPRRRRRKGGRVLRLAWAFPARRSPSKPAVDDVPRPSRSGTCAARRARPSSTTRTTST